MYTTSKTDVRRLLLKWHRDTAQTEAIFACAYLIGYHKVITEEMWEALRELVHEGILKW